MTHATAAVLCCAVLCCAVLSGKESLSKQKGDCKAPL